MKGIIIVICLSIFFMLIVYIPYHYLMSYKDKLNIKLKEMINGKPKN